MMVSFSQLLGRHSDFDLQTSTHLLELPETQTQRLFKFSKLVHEGHWVTLRGHIMD